MKVSSILTHKGTDVVTVTPETTVPELARILSEHNIGAVVVSSDGEAVEGIVSERDVVRAIAASAEVLTWRVSQIQTEVVEVCEPGDRTAELMSTMTERRIRHIPVVTESKLAGIISIGDVVRVQVAQLEEDKATLLGYITQ